MSLIIPERWTIFPIDPGTKLPMVPWNEEALPPGTKIVGPPGREEDGLGLVTGARSGVIGVDLDWKPVGHPKYPHGLDGMANLLALAPPGETFQTLTATTGGGGVHLYYRYPGWHVKTSVGEVGPGIDIKGDGGMIVLPPSLHKSGKRYEFLLPEGVTDLEALIAPLPEWLGALIAATSAKGAAYGTGGTFPMPALPSLELGENSTTEEGWRVIDRAVAVLKKCEEGRRNATLFRVCAELGDWNHVGDVSLEDARHAIGLVLATEGWGDPDKTNDTMERGFAKGRAKERTLVVISPDHMGCNESAIKALATREDVYVVGNGLARDTGGNGIAAMSRANLQEILSRVVDWRQRSKEGELKRSHPPEWSVAEIFDRGYWEGLREVEGFSLVPVLRADGTVATEAGWDSGTRVVLREKADVVDMSVDEALWLLEDVVADFPFAGKEHKAAWLCALLTPLAVHAFSGPMPLFLFEASTAGSGKSLLSSVTALIGAGMIPAVTMFTDNDEEMRKRITSIAKAPKAVVLLDNVGKGIKLGGPALCAVLTSPDRVWSDRLLGGNVQFEGKLNSVFYATSNQTELSEDMHRRICPIRLVPDVERPEKREGFRHPNLVGYVQENRGLLTSAAIRILTGYVANGRPSPPGVAWGSYSGWHRLVVGAVAWAGYGTPDAAVEALRENASADAAEGPALLAALDKVIGERGLEVQELYDLAFPRMGFGSPAKGAEDLRQVLDARFPKGCSVKLLGYLLREYKDRVFSGRRLVVGSKVNGIRRWVIEGK